MWIAGAGMTRFGKRGESLPALMAEASNRSSTKAWFSSGSYCTSRVPFTATIFGAGFS